MKYRSGDRESSNVQVRPQQDLTQIFQQNAREVGNEDLVQPPFHQEGSYQPAVPKPPGYGTDFTGIMPQINDAYVLAMLNMLLPPKDNSRMMQGNYGPTSTVRQPGAHRGPDGQLGPTSTVEKAPPVIPPSDPWWTTVMAPR